MINEEFPLEQDQEEELFEHYKFIVDKGQEMVRIDKYLLDRMPNTSRSKIQSAAKNGNIVVNGGKVKQNYKAKPSDEISIVLPYPVRELELIAENIPLDIVYEDDNLIVVNKPANMVVHPGYGNYRGTLVNALIYHIDQLPIASSIAKMRPGLVHRIDKHTTGTLVIAKNDDALANLAKQFYDRSTDRKYIALVWGDVTEDGTINVNVGRSLKNRKVMTVFQDESEGKHAITHYKVLQRFGYVTLIECKLETGRTHQIRIHMKSIGHPLFNDSEYGGNSILKGTTSASYNRFIENCFALIPGQALHAKSLGFTHPQTKKWMEFEVDLPLGFQTVINKWNTYTEAR
ncbi:MAG: RluA family pseudouridine synthase [Crocinitomicaceae bacterium]|nr:RluA family pseudouridine synthase [Crocinitomicaceae bacterium]